MPFDLFDVIKRLTYMIGHHCHTFSHIKNFSSFVWIQKFLDEHDAHYTNDTSLSSSS